MQKLLLLLSFVSLSAIAMAQEPTDTVKLKKMNAMKQRLMDSIRSERIDDAALTYPRIRQLTISQQINTGGTIRSKLHGKDFFSGKMRTARTSVNMNLPIVSGNKDNIVASVGFIHQYFDLYDVTAQDPNYAIADETRNIPMFNLNLSYSRRDTLFKIPVNLTASVGSLFNPGLSKYQFRFLGVLSVPLIRRENTNLTVGVIGFIDPTSLTPVIPLISYYKRFPSSGLDLIVDLPQRIALRKTLGKRNYLGIYSEVTGYNSFFGFNETTPTLPTNLNFAQTEIKSGLLYENRLTKKMVFSLSGGVVTMLRSRITEVGARQDKYLIDSKTGATPFVQAGISFLPFWEPFKKKRNIR